MFAVLTVFAVIVIVVCLAKGAFTKPYDAGSIGDVNKFKRDVQDPKVSSKQLDRNIRKGKYRKS